MKKYGLTIGVLLCVHLTIHCEIINGCLRKKIKLEQQIEYLQHAMQNESNSKLLWGLEKHGNKYQKEYNRI